jgi:hypothetical protein
MDDHGQIRTDFSVVTPIWRNCFKKRGKSPVDGLHCGFSRFGTGADFEQTVSVMAPSAVA